MTEYAPNWEQNQVLTWSGRWHILAEVFPPKGYQPEHARALCGAYAYTRDAVPKGYRKLQDIRKGITQAPVCKRCERAARVRSDD